VTNYQNPFRARTSEQQRDLFAFLRNFGAGALDLLPEMLWDRPLVIRSAPGGGKTSIMRLFTIESLRLIHNRRADLDLLAGRLGELGALDDAGPTRLGIQLGLDRDYRSLLDADIPPDVAERLFFRLLDARISVALIRAALAATDRSFPGDADSVRFEIITPSDSLDDAASRIGGLDGATILASARRVEADYFEMLDSLLPVNWEELAHGHLDLYALRLVSGARILVGGEPLRLLPLVMLDDGHELAAPQRDALLGRLLDRQLLVARWYSERFEALSPQELLAGDIEGRDYELLEIESAGRGVGPRGRTRFRFDRLVHDVGDRRAAPTLLRYGEGHTPFSELLGDETTELSAEQAAEVTALVRDRVETLADGRRYDAWLADAAGLRGYDAALRWRELEILIERDRDRPMQELFDFELGDSDAERLSGSNVREAAALMLAREFRLPYYFGAARLAKLSSQNIEQYLTVSGELFEEMLAEMTLNRRPNLPPARQDAVIRRSSERFWRGIPRRLPHGRDVQRLLISIVSIARRETFRPTAPYAPGVTGTALSMVDRDVLLDARRRDKIPGADRLFEALGSAIAYNVLSAELDRPVKGDRFMVLYLNRLLCARFGLPLGRGGFRERRLPIMAGWMFEPEPTSDADNLDLELGLE
jgi:hypothetical protein